MPSAQPKQIRLRLPNMGSSLGSSAMPMIVQIFSAADSGMTKFVSPKTYWQ